MVVPASLLLASQGARHFGGALQGSDEWIGATGASHAPVIISQATLRLCVEYVWSVVQIIQNAWLCCVSSGCGPEWWTSSRRGQVRFRGLVRAGRSGPGRETISRQLRTHPATIPRWHCSAGEVEEAPSWSGLPSQTPPVYIWQGGALLFS